MARTVALVLLALGAGFFALFTVGEVAGGDVSGLQHLPPAVLLAALFLLARRRPRTAGIVLLALAVPLAALYLAVLIDRDLPPTWALTIFGPPLLAGYLLLRTPRS